MVVNPRNFAWQHSDRIRPSYGRFLLLGNTECTLQNFSLKALHTSTQTPQHFIVYKIFGKTPGHNWFHIGRRLGFFPHLVTVLKSRRKASPGSPSDVGRPFRSPAEEHG